MRGFLIGKVDKFMEGRSVRCRPPHLKPAMIKPKVVGAKRIVLRIVLFSFAEKDDCQAISFLLGIC